MSLLIWLPLNGNFQNNGLSKITYTGTPTFKSVGKLGAKSYDLNYRTTITCADLANKSCFTIAFWAKVNTDTSLTTNWVDVIGFTDKKSDGTTGQLRWETCYASSSTRGISGHDNATYATTNGPNGNATTKDVWHHIVCVVGNDVREYRNGELTGTYTANGGTLTGVFWLGEAGKVNGEIQDVRIYDEALSLFEVKRLSQGLILHYPLNDNSIQQMNNCYNYPTFNTSTASGGWYHWGSSGHAGSYGQTTDKKYIYHSDQTYAHWVADGSEGTHNYLLYQYPEFEGGFRSLIVICKEENGLEINESICYPAWNSRNGGAIANKWTSITPLGNGFYLCKCEGISQNGSDDLVGIYIRIGYKVYFSECYLENNRTICSDFIFNNSIIYDTSGYCYNGNIIGLLTMSPGIARYKTSTYFNGSSYIQSIFNTGISGDLDFTVSFWINADAFTSDYAAVVWNGYSGANQAIAICVPGGKVSLDFWNNRYLTNSVVLTPNNWYHVCCTKKAGVVSTSNSHIYINGQEVTGTANNYSSTAPNISGNYKWIIGRLNDTSSRYITGKISDIRIYATALSADDVKALYENSAYIANNSTMYTYEFIEE